MTEYIDIEQINKLMIISLNRPRVYNALNTGLMRELKQALLSSDDNTEVSCIVLRGSGSAFCTGADIKEFGNQTNNRDAAADRANLTKEVHSIIPSLKKPVIASVHNYVYAGGCGIALACDMVVAADNSKFSYPEIKRGFVPALVTPNLTRITGKKKAFELLITGMELSSVEALEINIINKVVPTESLWDETLKLAGKISEYSQDSLTSLKSLFYKVSDVSFEESMEIAKAANVEMRQSEQFNKGVKEFIERS